MDSTVPTGEPGHTIVWNDQQASYRGLSKSYCSYQDTSTPECPCDPKDYHRDSIAGYSYTYDKDPAIRYLFSSDNLQTLSKNITTALRGVDPQGRDIVVAQDRILSVLSSVFWNGTRERIGDIYTRYVIPDCYPRNDLQTINFQTMNIIVSAIKDEYDTIANNKRLTVWNTLLGDFNTNGLRSHPPLKIRKKFPQRMMFNMNY